MISLGAILWLAGILAILIVIDVYVFQGIKTLFQASVAKTWIYRIFWITSVALYVAILFGVASFMFRFSTLQARTYIIAAFFLMTIPKLVFMAVLLIEDVYRLAFSSGKALWQRFADTSTDEPFLVGRRKFISQIGILAAAIPFSGILYGVTRGKYDFTLHRHEVPIAGLPDALDGFTITQLSDIHVGSFDDRDAVKFGVDLANEQRSDLMVFTGDLVNNRASEMDAWIDVFKVLEAPQGKFSTYGNHDYGDYVPWESPEAKVANLEWLATAHREIGFRLMMNQNATISKNGSSLSLLGVENWGLPPFPQKGDLTKALTGVDPSAVKILLSHDPTHFEAEVKSLPTPIHLTLSGHTHGMQFGVEIPGIKWSPVEYRYPRWAGLYSENGRYLNVNRGFGFIGLPGRVGIWPEITVLTLRKSA